MHCTRTPGANTHNTTTVGGDWGEVAKACLADSKSAQSSLCKCWKLHFVAILGNTTAFEQLQALLGALTWHGPGAMQLTWWGPIMLATAGAAGAAEGPGDWVSLLHDGTGWQQQQQHIPQRALQRVPPSIILTSAEYHHAQPKQSWRVTGPGLALPPPLAGGLILLLMGMQADCSPVCNSLARLGRARGAFARNCDSGVLGRGAWAIFCHHHPCS
jgi:hypothetical protein